MKYDHILEGKFLERPNRFIASVEILQGGETAVETVHVKNTGRCQELFVPGAEVYLEKSVNGSRKTGYDLVGVRKGDMLINVDSAAPNAVVKEWLESGGFAKDVTLVRPETVYASSRFDFYLEAGERRIFMEVKGVTLERQGAALFPDAPSERALRHVEELIRAKEEGYESCILFVIQMKGVSRFEPNAETQPEFADALVRAKEAGVRILAYDCLVSENSLRLDEPVPVVLDVERQKLFRIARPLLAWYDLYRRRLPWREEPTPYRVWVSEIMLQQTRVEAVKPYFERFMERLPDIAALAAVEEDELLKLWEGLGYYSRARNLRRAARQIMELYGGQMPADHGALLKLSGIGSYTSGAIASIAFGLPEPAVDGNVLRVLARLLEDGDDISDPAVKRKAEERLRPVMPQDRPGDFNQALMELGATVCLPNGAPKCAQCPWKELCGANRGGTQAEYPKKSAKRPRRIEQRTILVLRDFQRAAIRKRPPKGLLAGLYEFPSLEGHASQQEVLDWLKEQGVHALRIERLPDSKHIFTHIEWHMIGYSVRVDELEPMGTDASLLFVRPEETQEKYPIPSAFGAYAQYLNIRTGKENMKNGAGKENMKNRTDKENMKNVTGKKDMENRTGKENMKNVTGKKDMKNRTDKERTES